MSHLVCISVIFVSIALILWLPTLIIPKTVIKTYPKYNNYSDETISTQSIVAVTVGIPLVIIAVWSQFVKKYDINALITILLGYLVVYCLTILVVKILKIVVGKPRPAFEDICEPVTELPWTFASCSSRNAANAFHSFPSAHVAAAFVAVGYLGYLTKSASLASALAAGGLVVAFTRIYDYLHDFTDVSVGLVIGVLSGIIGGIYFEIKPSVGFQYR